MQILLNWLLTEGNYSHFKGKESFGKKKKDYAEEIVILINNAVLQHQHTVKDVLNKIEYVKQAFHSAHDFANMDTGTGLHEMDFGQFRDAMKKCCPWYFQLLPIFQDRASARAKITRSSKEAI